MKPAGLTRSRSSRRGSNSPERSFDELFRTPQTVFRLALHGIFCIFTLFLGFLMSREALLVVVSLKQPPDGSIFAKTISRFNGGEELSILFPYVSEPKNRFPFPIPPPEQVDGGPIPPSGKSSRVHVGRHQILVRSWPHPEPLHTAMAYRLMEIVQHTQNRIYGLKERKQLIVITPTYVRTFQAMFMTGLMHTLRLVPGPLIWIVIEAGGTSNETAALLAESGLSFVHLKFGKAMPSGWEVQRHMEARLRVEGLRFVRDEHLDGVVAFADDSNTYSLEFFDEVQRVKWIGAFSLGLLPHSGLSDALKEDSTVEGGLITSGEKNDKTKQSFPIHGPVCNLTGHLIGWYAPSVTSDKVQGGFKQEEPESPQSLKMLEWTSFVLNARLLWEDAAKPPWILNWEDWAFDKEFTFLSPLDMVTDARLVEPLGNCGQDVWLWWLRVEARADSEFPSRWEIEPPLEVVIPSKHTPWHTPWLEQPSAVPSPPTVSPSIGMHNQIEKPRGKQSARVTRGKRSSHHSDKRKHRNSDHQQATRFLGDRTMQ